MSIKNLEDLKKQLEAEGIKFEEKQTKKENIETKKKEIKKEEENKDSKENTENKVKNKNIEDIENILGIDIQKEIVKITNIKPYIVKNIIDMIDEGNTIPFIARYRKEKTESMDDEKLRTFEEVLNYQTNLIERKEEVARIIKEQGKLDDKLKELLVASKTNTEVEDIYRPFKQKKKTRATEAKRKGLDGLADEIRLGNVKKIEEIASKYLNEEVESIEDAIAGAKDILAEEISDNSRVRKNIRDEYFKNSEITSVKKKEKEDEVLDENGIYTIYYDFKEKTSNIPSHRYLAITRGENEKILTVSFLIDEEKIYNIIRNVLIKDGILKENNIRQKEIYDEIIEDSFKRLIKSSVEREIRQIKKEESDEVAIDIFGNNLKQLLLTPPIKDVNILGFDPGFRNGCKIATIDKTGKFTDELIVHVTMPNDDVKTGMEKVAKLVKKHDIDIIAIGNGTASRESEKLISDMIKGTDTKYIIVSEAGASVYSASKIAKEEFPDTDVSIRGAISIARRLQDPLSELVKIDPKSIGVGQYQHDVNQKRLVEKLDNITQDTVNKVGVNLNTATFSLLSYVSGLSKRQAKNIVKYREKNGRYNTRQELLEVTGIGENSYRQAVGFMRIYESKNAFDITGIHPETYNIAEEILNAVDAKEEDILDLKKKEKIDKRLNEITIEKLKEKSKILSETSDIVIKDIITEILRPGRDIREDLPKPILREDILKFEDIKIGDVLKGTVRNVTAFGAFVDIGLHNDGLVHISELSKKYVKDPNEIVSVGDVVEVKVISKEDKQEKISLSMKQV